jgi:hypothetical protein
MIPNAIFGQLFSALYLVVISDPQYVMNHRVYIILPFPPSFNFQEQPPEVRMRSHVNITKRGKGEASSLIYTIAFASARVKSKSVSTGQHKTPEENHASWVKRHRYEVDGLGVVTGCAWLSRPNIPPTGIRRGRRSEIKGCSRVLKLLLIGRIPSDPYTRLKEGCFRTGMACCHQSWWVPQLEPAYGIRLRKRWCLEDSCLMGDR